MGAFARRGAVVAVLALSATVWVPTGAGASTTVALGIDATVDASGAITVLVTAPGCEVTPPAEFPSIVVQARNAVTGEVGEGAVAVGEFTAPGQGVAVIPAGTPVSSFLLTVNCNDGALHGEQAFTLSPTDNLPPTPVATAPVFTG